MLEDVFVYEAIVGDISSGGRSSEEKRSTKLICTAESDSCSCRYDSIADNGWVRKC
jgi:hypothetical protein